MNIPEVIFLLINDNNEYFVGWNGNEAQWSDKSIIFTDGQKAQYEYDKLQASYPGLNVEILEYYF